MIVYKHKILAKMKIYQDFWTFSFSDENLFIQNIGFLREAIELG